MKKHDLTPTNMIFLAALAAFFAAFLFYPLSHTFTHAFYVDGRFTLTFFKLMFTNPIQREAILNSVKLGLVTTLATTLLSLPLAFMLVRVRFRGKGILSGLILVPMVMPPFVGAIGMKQMFARFGSINLLLIKLGIVDAPIDWFGGGGFVGVVIMEVLHLYPIMYLNVAAALANVDPSLEEAAKNMGAGPLRLFRTITFPLMLPGYFAGAIIVFIWAFTDLGTPLIFDYSQVVAVQIFNMVSDIHENPMGYALVVVVILMTLLFFYLSKRFVGGRAYEMISKGRAGAQERIASGKMTLLIYASVLTVTLIALIPHLSVMLTSISERWFMSVLPEQITLKYYGKVFTHDLTLLSIRNSFFLSSLSTLADVLIGVTVAYLLTRKVFPGRNLMDSITMLPLALPGLVIAFGYVAGFSGTFLDARNNPIPLLVIAYAIRRLPYMVRAAYAGFQQTSVVLEEASLNMGAGPARTFRKITFPLVLANLVAGGILCFAFAMLEVSDSLILAMKEQFYPITKTIYVLLGRIADGPYIASAMGMLGMALLTVSLMLAGKFLGKRMGELFRA
ncbi:MAG: iron ABC transporter permease [Candidatus Latescibacteria bacterium]|nr:iron ABC transporter permease [Candidatus Latescibacterota bacterium]